MTFLRAFTVYLAIGGLILLNNKRFNRKNLQDFVDAKMPELSSMFDRITTTQLVMASFIVILIWPFLFL